MIPPKAQPDDFLGRFREVISDPLNLLIEKVPMAGIVEENEVYLHNGNRVPVAGEEAYYAAFSQLLAINRGVHEPLEEYVFQEALRNLPDAPTMIELGAYWGHYSMWLKKRRPNARTILVEPEENNLAVGMNNFARNGYKGEFIQAFVGTGQFEVDQFCRTHDIGSLDILHVDIQGHEVEMLAGAQQTLGERRVDYLFISTHSQQLHHEVLDGLKLLGYRIEVSGDFDDETTSCDGFVFASNPQVPEVFNNFVAPGRTKICELQPDQLISALFNVRESSVTAPANSAAALAFEKSNSRQIDQLRGATEKLTGTSPRR